MKNKTIYIPVLIGIAVSAGYLLGVGTPRASYTIDSPLGQSQNRDFNLLSELINYIESEYVDTVQRQAIIDETVQHLLQELDPHSYYISAEELAAMNEPLEGNFEGIGVQFNIRKDTVIVVTPLSGGPSEKVGIKAGDRIIAVDGETIAGIGIKNSDVLKKLKGHKGTKVEVQVLRNGRTEHTFTITRDRIPIESVEAGYLINPTTGYLKISRFAKTTYDEFMTEAEQLREAGAQHLIIDLRGNGGGIMDAAVRIADEFIPSGDLIVYTEGRSRPREEYYASNRDSFVDLQVSVLIDESSASASEILAGAIQDNDRGEIIGVRSFGKGLVQEQTQWPDGSATRLTVARYYTPSGRCIQKPYGESTSDYYSEVFLRDSVHAIEKDSTEYFTKSGRVVFGGGGISPDIEASYDTSGYSTTLSNLLYRGLIYDFAWNYVDQHRDELEKHGDAEDFVRDFRISKQMDQNLQDFAMNQGVMVETDEYNHSLSHIHKRLKAYIGRNLFGDDAFYPVWNKSDPYIEKALN